MKKLLLGLGLLLSIAFASASPNPVFNAAVTNSSVLIKVAPSGGQVYFVSYHAINTNTADVYIQFFDAATAGAVIPGTTSPLFVMGIPSNGGVLDGSFAQGIAFSKGIVITVTTTVTGGSAPASTNPVTIWYQ